MGKDIAAPEKNDRYDLEKSLFSTTMRRREESSEVGKRR